jgi:hypothetical protein
MEQPKDVATSLLRKHATDALRRARKLPVGHARNDLRQLAVSLLWLDKKGMQAVQRTPPIDREQATRE